MELPGERSAKRMREVLQRLCLLSVVLIIFGTALNFNQIPWNLEQYNLQKSQELYEVPDIELKKISDTQIKVKDKIIQFENVSDNTLKWYADQMEKCPNYLFETVDEIHIVTRKRLLELKQESKSTTIGFHKHYGTYSIVVLSDYKTTDRTVFLHEAIHAFDVQHTITSSLEFQNIYQAEGLEYDERAKDIKEYFAYSYVDYLMKDFDYSKYPLTTEFYKKLENQYV